MNTLMLNNGVVLYDKIILADNCNLGDVEFNLSAYEDVPVNLSLSSTAELSCDTEYINTDLLQQLAGEPYANDKNFTFEYDMPIMIQARWHKKARVRKKWLRRWGMKQDKVKVRCVGAYLTMDGQDDYWNWQMNANNPELLWRPDQKRRERKIEWV